MKEITIVALGDSITNGVGIGDVTEEDTYRHHIQTDLPKMTETKVKVINSKGSVDRKDIGSNESRGQEGSSNLAAVFILHLERRLLRTRSDRLGAKGRRGAYTDGGRKGDNEGAEHRRRTVSLRYIEK